MQHQIEGGRRTRSLQHEERVPRQHDGSRRDQRRASRRPEAALKAAQSKVAAERAAIEKRREDASGDRRRVRGRRAAKIVAAMDNKGAIETLRSASPRSAAPRWRAPKASAAPSARCVCARRCSPKSAGTSRSMQCDSCNRILYFVAPAGTRGTRGTRSTSGTLVITAYFDGGARAQSWSRRLRRLYRRRRRQCAAPS